MFVRKKPNQSGSISIQIISKKNSRYKVIETIGYSKDKDEIDRLYEEGKKRVRELEPNLLDFIEYQDEIIKLSTKSVRVIGDELIFGKIFSDIGCEKINFRNSQIFKSLVITRLLYPGSKLYLIDYLNIYKKEKIDKNKIYRVLDTIYQKEIKDKIEECIYSHTKKIMDDTIIITFYDVTTLHFESESEDDLRKIGFSKEGRLNRPQIQLGLFTTLQGYPLSFEVYEGNKFEGHTITDVLEKFQKRFNLSKKPIVVADKGMLNNANIAYLEKNGYKYILAYKIKHIEQELKDTLANLVFASDGALFIR